MFPLARCSLGRHRQRSACSAQRRSHDEHCARANDTRGAPAALRYIASWYPRIFPLYVRATRRDAAQRKAARSQAIGVGIKNFPRILLVFPFHPRALAHSVSLSHPAFGLQLSLFLTFLLSVSHTRGETRLLRHTVYARGKFSFRACWCRRKEEDRESRRTERRCEREGRG